MSRKPLSILLWVLVIGAIVLIDVFGWGWQVFFISFGVVILLALALVWWMRSAMRRARDTQMVFLQQFGLGLPGQQPTTGQPSPGQPFPGQQPGMPAPPTLGLPPVVTTTATPAPPRPAPPPAGKPPATKKEESGRFNVERPDSLPSFGDVGGMEEVKRDLSETFGLMLAFAGEAEAYRITWNGVLLHGPPGVGKTFLAQAVAGEFGLNLIHISTGDMVSAYRGESAKNVEEAFRFAARNIPCVLFFDEFDSIAQNRQDWPDQEARRTVNELLQSLEEWREVREMVVLAATNALDELDPAVVRPGRFDRHVRIDLPDTPARKAIFRAQLEGRPLEADVDLDDLAARSSGMTPAAIARTVQLASLQAFREAAERGEIVRITMAHMLAALKERGGKDRPTFESWTWDSLVLPQDVKEELQELEALVAEPERARALGIEPPTGVLLTGPPGTGKTSIARVLAAQAQCSFYPISSADVTSKWLGESERNIQRLFQRARENRPSIVFIDEIDAIASRRGEWGSYDRQINELLEEMDGIVGQEGVLVIGATNRPDKLDPALLRGGRLSRTIEIPLPDSDARHEILKLMTRRMPTVAVDLAELAEQAEGFSGADLKALCQQAGLRALVRDRRSRRGPAEGATQPAEEEDKPVAVLEEDFARALDDLKESKRRNAEQPVAGSVVD